MNPATKRLSLLLMLSVLVALVLASGAGGAAFEELPDPLDRGSYAVNRVDPLKLGQTTFQEPNFKGGAATGANESLTAEIRGVMYQPEGYAGKSPLLLLVHGNHGSCDTGSGPACTIFKRNDEGYAYLGENLASWGYTVVSLDQDELISRQDSLGKGMHERRLLIMAMLDRLKEASEDAVPTSEHSNVGGLLAGKLDMTRIGLMGHSRGGDAVSSFVEYDHSRPVGERYPLRAVISLAPVDYERHVPFGVPFMAVFGSCDGDVSNLQAARLYERSQYSGDPYPKFQVEQIGGNHDAYNTVWQADGDDANTADVACGPDVAGGREEKGGKATANTHSIRLSGEAGPHFEVLEGETKPYRWGNGEKLNPLVNTRISGDPALMGDQEKMGLATMAAFFRRYVGGEGAFEPYLTGELAAEGKPSIPLSACPDSEAGKRIPCADRVADSYTAAPDERLDVIRPDTEHPTTVSALGTKISASGLANPYPKKNGGVTPRPATTANGIDWCNPDPKQQEPGQLKEGENPTSAKPCPAPGLEALGGQAAGTRERAPVNGSYGRQLSVAWEEPVENTGSPAKLSTTIPAADGDVSSYRALYLAAAVNFFDPRNPARGEEGLWNPEAASQDFTIAVTDAEGHEASVEAADPRYGTALQQTLGSTTARVHVILRDIRVPLADLESQGVDLTRVRRLELRFGELGMPQSGSLQLADLRFEQPASGFSNVLIDSTAVNAGPGEGPPSSGPDPVAEIASEQYKRADGSYEMPNPMSTPGGSVWTVDDDGAQCPNAQFEHVQEAVEYASPWDTIAVCPGTYAESSTPVNSELNPVQAEAKDGLTINKPLKIVGAGASLVKIRPAFASGISLAGTEPFLRDGGGNVVTVSRQSLGSTEYDEMYVDISGVTIESPNNYAEAGVAFFNSSGRIANSVIGPLKRAANAGELATKPHGYGVLVSNSLVGAGSGTAERQVTIAGSRVFGYQSGGIRFDDGRGADASATANEPSGIREVGYVRNTTVEGQSSSVFPQTGIEYHAGAAGKVSGSSIAKNLFTATPRKSVGILLTGAETLGGGVSIAGSLIAGNGYGLFNADLKNEGVREAAPVTATGNFWGTDGTPVAGSATTVGPPDVEGVSGNDGAANPSVQFEPVLGTAPALPPVPALPPDASPLGGIVNPANGEAVEAGVPLEPVVLAEDDYGVRTVSLTANGAPVGTRTEAPYGFTWTPTASEIGTSVQLEATIADSSGQTKTTSVSVPVKKSAAEAGAERAAEEAKAARERAEAAAGETKKAIERAEAAAREAKEKAEALGKRTEAPSTGRVLTDRRKGSARLTVTVSSPGQLVVSGPGIRTVSGSPAAPGGVQVVIEAKGRALRTLSQKGRVAVTVKVSFTGPDGKTAATTTTVVLVKR
ncbi:MAG TPA: Ig-like domain-containing protein [Solirubrobacterales bacterium]|nr:Ig-like domain-containing protein [Solirubrobacterales bacterium]